MNEGLFISSIVVIFLVVCVLLEALLITAFKVTRFPRALLHSFFVNSASVGMVYLIWPLLRRANFDEGKAFPLLPILIGSTLLVEALLLTLLNRQQPWSRMFLVSGVMNAASFAVLFLLLSLH